MQVGRQGRYDDGTIMVDALVAVVIVGLMIAACLMSLNLSHRISAEARQTRQARLVLTTVIETAPRMPGAYSGIRDGFPYKINVRTDGDAGLCQIEAETTGRHIYRLAATRWCHVETGA